MKTVPATVTDKDGNLVAAQLIVCPNCDENTFIIYVVDKHQHLQCAYCDETFCDGSCK